MEFKTIIEKAFETAQSISEKEILFLNDLVAGKTSAENLDIPIFVLDWNVFNVQRILDSGWMAEFQFELKVVKHFFKSTDKISIYEKHSDCFKYGLIFLKKWYELLFECDNQSSFSDSGVFQIEADYEASAVFSISMKINLNQDDYNIIES